MIEFIGGVVVLLCVIVVGWSVFNRVKTNSGSSDTPLSKLTENDLISRFNKLTEFLVNPGSRTLDDIAKELVNVLKEYKCRKVEQFIESEQLLAKNRNHLDEQIAKLKGQINKLKADAKALKKENMTEEDLENGALYMAQIAETEKVLTQIEKTREENEARFENVEKQVKNFNVKYTLKETAISNMIVQAKTTKNISTVDLKLNDLISEFKDKVQDNEIEYNVKAQINGTQDEEETNSPEFEANREKFIEDFKNFIG